MRLPKSERFTDDCKKCGWCPERENSTVPLGDCGLCFDCMDKFVDTAVSHGGMDGCSTGDCPHEREAECVASQGELVAEQAALLDARAGRIQRQNKMLVEKDARLAELEAVVASAKVLSDAILHHEMQWVTCDRDGRDDCDCVFTANAKLIAAAAQAAQRGEG